MLRLTDLREILRYVPRFRDKVFVIAIDGAIVDHENFPNLLLDIFLLRSLNVRVALVHGAAKQIESYAKRLGMTPSDLDGTGITDAETLQVALTAANRVTHEILEGLSANDLRAACPNAVVAHPAGIIGGIDKQFTGRIERIDGELLDAFLAKDIIPVIPPIGIDGSGRSYRLNSDSVAVEIAKTLRAVKLIYLTTESGVPGPKGVIRQLTVEEAETHLKKKQKDLSTEMATKLSHAARAGREGVERIHIIDGREQEGLLGEVFSNEGIGTLVYTNEYQAIRPAQKKDVRAVYALIQQGIATDELVRRTRAEVERQIGDFYVFELDKNPVACVAIHPYPDEKKAELACLFVDERYANRGIGGKLISFAEAKTKEKGFVKLISLSTQAVNYFVSRGGFTLGKPDDLPPNRREAYEKNGRKSQVLIKALQ